MDRYYLEYRDGWYVVTNRKPERIVKGWYSSERHAQAIASRMNEDFNEDEILDQLGRYRQTEAAF